MPAPFLTSLGEIASKGCGRGQKWTAVEGKNGEWQTTKVYSR